MSATALRKYDDVHAQQRRTRACLKCSEEFESAWFGERVCRKCKSGSTWQSSGMDMVSARAAGGRR